MAETVLTVRKRESIKALERFFCWKGIAELGTEGLDMIGMNRVDCSKEGTK